MIINNVKLVLENEVVHGSLEVQDGEIRAFAESQSHLSEAMDGEGGWLLPGLIELHTDNLDKFFTPRPKVDWPAHSAMSSHDALMVASGITTVLDAVAIGDVRDGGDRLENLEKMINAIEETQKRGVNRAEHRLHLRCELPHHTTLPLFEKLVQREPVTLVSLMDHSPGQRQFANREKYREYYQGKYSLTDAQMQQYEEEQLALAARWSQPNRESIAAMCRARHIALANHPAILEIKRLRRIFSHQLHRLRQRKAVALVIGDAKCRIEQAGGVVVGREDIQQAKLRQFTARHVAGVRTAAHDIRRAHQHVHAMLARGFCRFERGGKFGDHAAKLVRFGNVGVRGVIVAGEGNLSRAAQGGDGFAIRL